MQATHPAGVVIVRVWSEGERVVMKVVVDRTDHAAETVGYFSSVEAASLAVADTLRSLASDQRAGDR